MFLCLIEPELRRLGLSEPRALAALRRHIDITAAIRERHIAPGITVLHGHGCSRWIAGLKAGAGPVTLPDAELPEYRWTQASPGQIVLELIRLAFELAPPDACIVLDDPLPLLDPQNRRHVLELLLETARQVIVGVEPRDLTFVRDVLGDSAYVLDVTDLQGDDLDR